MFAHFFRDRTISPARKFNSKMFSLVRAVRADTMLAQTFNVPSEIAQTFLRVSC
jgi:hypothetical protein